MEIVYSAGVMAIYTYIYMYLCIYMQYAWLGARGIRLCTYDSINVRCLLLLPFSISHSFSS